MHLLRSIEICLRRTGIPPTRFGREAVSDPRFVMDLRNGRTPRAVTEQRVRAYLNRLEQEIR